MILRHRAASVGDWLRVGAVGVAVFIGIPLIAWVSSLIISDLGADDRVDAVLDPCHGITDSVELAQCKDYWRERGELERAP